MAETPFRYGSPRGVAAGVDLGPRLSPDEIRAINQAAAHLDQVLALTERERVELAGKLFAIAGNPRPDQEVREDLETLTSMPPFVSGTLEGHTVVADKDIAQIRELLSDMQRGIVTSGVRACAGEIEYLLAGWCAP